jgi:hypothetical protein
MKQIITYKDITLEDVTLNQAQNTLRPKMELGEFFTVRREGRTPRKGRTSSSVPADYVKVLVRKHCPICNLILKRQVRFIKKDVGNYIPHTGIINKGHAAVTCQNPICQDFREDFEKKYGHSPIATKGEYTLCTTLQYDEVYTRQYKGYALSNCVEDYIEEFIEKNKLVYISKSPRWHEFDSIDEYYMDEHVFDLCIDSTGDEPDARNKIVP